MVICHNLQWLRILYHLSCFVLYFFWLLFLVFWVSSTYALQILSCPLLWILRFSSMLFLRFIILWFRQPTSIILHIKIDGSQNFWLSILFHLSCFFFYLFDSCLSSLFHKVSCLYYALQILSCIFLRVLFHALLEGHDLVVYITLYFLILIGFFCPMFFSCKKASSIILHIKIDYSQSFWPMMFENNVQQWWSLF